MTTSTQAPITEQKVPAQKGKSVKKTYKNSEYTVTELESDDYDSKIFGDNNNWFLISYDKKNWCKSSDYALLVHMCFEGLKGDYAEVVKKLGNVKEVQALITDQIEEYLDEDMNEENRSKYNLQYFLDYEDGITEKIDFLTSYNLFQGGRAFATMMKQYNRIGEVSWKFDHIKFH